MKFWIRYLLGDVPQVLHQLGSLDRNLAYKKIDVEMDIIRRFRKI